MPEKKDQNLAVAVDRGFDIFAPKSEYSPPGSIDPFEKAPERPCLRPQPSVFDPPMDLFSKTFGY
jgi:hypothetical protein